MKNIRLKSLILLSAAFLFFLGFGSTAGAVTLAEVGGLDPLIAVTSLSNSAAGTEADWINSILGTTYDANYVEDNKIIWTSANYQMVTDGAANQWAFPLLYEEGYFMLKTGNGTYNNWLFQNDPSTAWGTFIIDRTYLAVTVTQGVSPFNVTGDDQTIIFDINDITSISHYTKAGPPSVPEPATMLLLGAGLLGLAGLGRKKLFK